METSHNKMKVEIWSDVICPFCYIGKRKFENALVQFSSKNKVEVVWKSFLLSPDIKTDINKNINEFLSEHKGITLQEAKNLNLQVTRLAAQVGLVYNFEKLILANTFKAHRFVHFANCYGLQNQAEEKLFEAYFTLGKNIDDNETLLKLGEELELDTIKLKTTLETEMYADNVKRDIYEAHHVGVRGVPFFVFDRKYAVSGAQETSLFFQTLNKSFEGWQGVHF